MEMFRFDDRQECSLTGQDTSDTLLAHFYMPTDKTRVNVSFSSELEMSLLRLAKRDNMPYATKARELLARAIEIEEDDVWDHIASRRDTSSSRFVAQTVKVFAIGHRSVVYTEAERRV